MYIVIMTNQIDGSSSIIQDINRNNRYFDSLSKATKWCDQIKLNCKAIFSFAVCEIIIFEV